MAKMRGTSNIPIIAGLIIGILCFAGSFYSKSSAVKHFATAGFKNSESAINITGAANAFLILGIVCSILIIFFSLISKKIPSLSGTVLVILSFLYGVTALSTNMFSIILFIALFIVGIICSHQETYEVKDECNLP